MADLIDRQAALDAIESYFGDLPIVVHHDMRQLIKDIPTADVTFRQVRDYCLKRRLCLMPSEIYERLITGRDN